MVLKKTPILKKLLNLGFHIGHSIFDTRYNFKINNQFFIGQRNRYQVLNLNFTIFYLQRSMFFLKKLTSNFSNVMFYYSNLTNNSNLNLAVKLFMKNRIYSKTRWSFVYLKWVPGIITNYNFCFTRFIKLIIRKIYVSDSTKRTNLYNKTRFLKKFLSYKIFITLFIKIFFLLEETLYLDDTLDIQFEFKKLSHLFRVVLFLRFWKSFFWVPDLLCTVNPNRLNSPINEFSILKIPVISLCDSNSNFSDISYPIIMNDDSVVSLLFIVSLFSNITKESHLDHYSF
jgi:ribosomal protein S2